MNQHSIALLIADGFIGLYLVEVALVLRSQRRLVARLARFGQIISTGLVVLIALLVIGGAL